MYRPLLDVVRDLKEYIADYQAFMCQHKTKYKEIVESWDLPKYLEVMDNFFLISRIRGPDTARASPYSITRKARAQKVAVEDEVIVTTSWTSAGG